MKAAALSRRGALAALVGLLGAGSGRSQSAAVPAAASAGAWALWDEFVSKLVAGYFEPLNDADITRRAVEDLLSDLGASASLRPNSYGNTPDDRKRTFRQLILQLVSVRGTVSATALVERSMELFCENHLKYSHYVPAAVLAELSRIGSAGTGMAVKARAGRYYCHPFPKSDPERKGIDQGDELISIDGRPLAGMGPFRVKPKLYGAEGTKVRLAVRKPSGRILECEITRTTVARTPVSRVAGSSGPAFRVPLFDGAGVAELRRLLAEVPADALLTLDLRGNEGGEIQLAADAAGLFLPGSRPLDIGYKTRRSGDREPIVTNEPRAWSGRRVTILQNGDTASSAELFIQSLRAGGGLRLTIGGGKSYGKTTFQGEEVLGNGGGSLILSEGRLVDVAGNSWDTGIVPTFGA